MLPPGRARLATNPEPTGSLSNAMTMGIVTVASLAGRVDAGPAVTMTSTLRRTSSAASSGRRSSFPSAYRHSMTMFFPSTYPSSRSPCRNASMRAALMRMSALGILCEGLSSAAALDAETLSAKSTALRAKTAMFFLHRSFLLMFSSFNCLLFALVHLMTLSALASTFGGIVRPICFAAFRLITNSNFIGCSTGRSAGLAPFRILST